MHNAVKAAAREGRRVRGIHLTFPSTNAIEVLATVGLDFVYLDGEHGAFGQREVELCCLAAERHGLTTIARVPDRSVATITSFLDRGVLSLVVPHVDGVDDAREAVAAAYYAPLGNRSFGGGRPHYGLGIADRPGHLAAANAQIGLCIMIESRGALESAHEIARLEGIDYLSFGMNDLAQSLGHPGGPDHPEVLAAVRDATARINAAGKPVREDFIRYAWINDVLVAGARHFLD